MQILVVEDDFLLQVALVQFLEEHGHNVCGTAETAEDAVAVANERKPDLVLMDVNLFGEKDGIWSAKAIQENLDSRVIFVTACVDSPTLSRMKSASPFGIVLKPYNNTVLLKEIQRCADVL